MPEAWSSADDSPGQDDYPGSPGSVRPPGSRPLAGLLPGPIAIVLMLAFVFLGLPLLVALVWFALVIVGTAIR